MEQKTCAALRHSVPRRYPPCHPRNVGGTAIGRNFLRPHALRASDAGRGMDNPAPRGLAGRGSGPNGERDYPFLRSDMF